MNTLIGPARDRVDGPAKVTGAARYSAEIHLPGLVHGVFAPSTAAAGRLTRIDVAGAERAPGVIAVFTHQTMPRLARQPVFSYLKLTGMSFSFLQDDRILYGGQPIAMVIACTREQAVSAAELIDAEYTHEPPVATLADAEANARELDKLFGIFPAAYRRGDTDARLLRAEVRVSASYTYPAQRHHPLELSSTTAVWDGPRLSLTVYETTQGVSMTQLNLCDRLDLEPENVRVISRFLGGGFGVKGVFWMHTALTALAAREVGRPVKLVITRDQTTAMMGYREQQRQDVTLGATWDGTLTAIRHHKLGATSMVDDWAEPSCGPSTMLYACDNVDTGYRVAPVNAMTPTFTRGVGNAPGLFGLESAMDELACELRIDPLELRMRNHADVDPRSGAAWSSKSLKECYARGAEMIGWHDRNPGIGAMREDGWLIGYGMETALYNVALLEQTQVRLRLYASGRVRVEFGGQDIGTGTYTVAALTVADALGIPTDAVEVALGDTDLPRVGSSIAQASAAAVSSAAHLAARALLRRLSTVAAADPRSPLHQADPDSINGPQCGARGSRRPRRPARRGPAPRLAHDDGRHQQVEPGLGPRRSCQHRSADPRPPGFHLHLRSLVRRHRRRPGLRAHPRAPPGCGVRRRAHPQPQDGREPDPRAARSWASGRPSSKRRRPTAPRPGS
jgi:xanthine dehydrogenase YagR molybdenum-binding subunit